MFIIRGMEKEKVISKIKLLLKLAESPNENESANAKALANSLIEKYGISPEELKDNTFSYPEENILFRTFVRSFWKNRLAIVLANQFFCYIIEQKISSTVEDLPVEEFVYFLYGEEQDIENVKRLYLNLEAKIDGVITEVCRGRGELFCDSFSEGLMNAVKYRIENGDFDFKIQELKEEKNIKQDTIIKKNVSDFPDKKPVENKRDIVEDKKPIDIIAYFKGEKAGMNLELEDLLSGKDIDVAALMTDGDEDIEDEEDDLEFRTRDKPSFTKESLDFLSELAKKLGGK